ncbi:MAG: hypothetical protein Q8M88_06185 [Phenylobacterium sp.]|uniref:hypothetical protein n=1 Tax=Phenylobacterium sp. TaxID=1871053 RepID=UPI0027325131|nr:hypothetical protein [Phenylobacterium sp.]MDP3174005.1 hypothetical protein [Phenylobacterium sp.]
MISWANAALDIAHASTVVAQSARLNLDFIVRPQEDPACAAASHLASRAHVVQFAQSHSVATF